MLRSQQGWSKKWRFTWWNAGTADLEFRSICHGNVCEYIISSQVTMQQHCYEKKNTMYRVQYTKVPSGTCESWKWRVLQGNVGSLFSNTSMMLRATSKGQSGGQDIAGMCQAGWPALYRPTCTIWFWGWRQSSMAEECAYLLQGVLKHCPRHTAEVMCPMLM